MVVTDCKSGLTVTLNNCDMPPPNAALASGKQRKLVSVKKTCGLQDSYPDEVGTDVATPVLVLVMVKPPVIAWVTVNFPSGDIIPPVRSRTLFGIAFGCFSALELLRPILGSTEPYSLI